MIHTVLTISHLETLISDRNPEVGSYSPDHNAKFNGVKNTAKAVATADKLTDNATFAFATEDIKLETLPPGQEATINMPKAILGTGFINMINKKVTSGSKKN